MSRLPLINRDALAPDDQAVWDRIAAVRTGVRGPFGVLLHVPTLADRVAALEDYFRFNAALPAVDRELVIMATAREVGARYPWARHEARGREVGTTPEAIEAVRVNGTLEQLTPREHLLVEIVRTLLRTHALPDALYTRGLAELGRQQLIETVALAGHYGLIGLTVNAFDVAPPDNSPTF
ncbi:MAG TPA: carboxymuconolactone decarboxylase family protein [Nitrospiraceae bacterium]|nr:carboxymuconolactone decarboxylase family protein [Nitrospiraceae bacterium]